jgi:hypothetical protein
MPDTLTRDTPVGTKVYWGGNFHSGASNLVCGIYLGAYCVEWTRSDRTTYTQDMRVDVNKVFVTPLQAMLRIMELEGG